MSTKKFVLLGALGIVLALFMKDDAGIPVEYLLDRWAPPPSEFVAVLGVGAHVRDQRGAHWELARKSGHAVDAAIVLIHGTSSSLHTWEPWVQALLEARPKSRVISFDLPGFGLTGPLPGSNYSMSFMVHFTSELIDTLLESKTERFVIGGNSLGGCVAWRVATAFPTRVEKLLLVDAAGSGRPPVKQPIGFLIARSFPFLRYVIGKIPLPRFLVAKSVVTAHGSAATVTEALIDRYYALATRQGNARAMIEQSSFMAADLLVHKVEIEKLRALECPALIMWGAKDSLIPVIAATDFAERIPRSKVVIYDDLGHLPMEEDPARTIRDVLDFLSSQ